MYMNKPELKVEVKLALRVLAREWVRQAVDLIQYRSVAHNDVIGIVRPTGRTIGVGIHESDKDFYLVLTGLPFDFKSIGMRSDEIVIPFKLGDDLRGSPAVRLILGSNVTLGQEMLLRLMQNPDFNRELQLRPETGNVRDGGDIRLGKVGTPYVRISYDGIGEDLYLATERTPDFNPYEFEKGVLAGRRAMVKAIGNRLVDRLPTLVEQELLQYRIRFGDERYPTVTLINLGVQAHEGITVNMMRTGMDYELNVIHDGKSSTYVIPKKTYERNAMLGELMWYLKDILEMNEIDQEALIDYLKENVHQTTDYGIIAGNVDQEVDIFLADGITNHPTNVTLLEQER
ncbi:hypothetical protein [Vibrio phage pTD1]|uniref:Uncharacterized protein n=1 Tax=Vibrio phage pTD1 TaxID=1938577 RepID=A0A1Q2U337_9CAUD|nr:hypothetical protein FDH33_gp148 [Vibrio phage pTD1]BAW98357.1 hypothetical protein [Vibrio phage pTD1]